MFMMRLRGLVLLLSFLRGGARRSIRIDDSRDSAKKQDDLFVHTVKMSGEGLGVLIPRGLRTHMFQPAALHAGALPEGSKQHGLCAGRLKPHRGPLFFCFGSHRAKVALREATDREEDQLPPKVVDSRGFVVPQVGDVVKIPSKWPGEWDVAQVDFVQFIGSRNSYEVDLLMLSPIGNDTYRLPGRKPAAITLDIGKITRLSTEYVPERDAFRVNPGDVAPLARPKDDPDVIAQGLAEYAELKARLLREAILLGVAGSALSFPVFGIDVASAFGFGAIAGCAYLSLLQKETDSVGSDAPMPRVVAALVQGRLGVPALLVFCLYLQQLSQSGSASLSPSVLAKKEFIAGILGFLGYKLPLFVRSIADAAQELASNEDALAPAEAGAGGSLGLALRVAQSSLKKTSDEPKVAAGGARGPRLVVLSGPSGVGKELLIAKLIAKEPDRFGVPVFCTTRAPCAGEVDELDYSFLSDAQFDAMINNSELIDWASVDGQRYGTSLRSIETVSATGKLCLLEADVKVAETLAKREDLQALFIWIAPPSLDALRERLRSRGRDTPAQIEERIRLAAQEIEFSLSARFLDNIVVNDNLDDTQAELMSAINDRFE